MASKNDTHHMNSALSLARRGLGRTWPNPSVGCVIVKNGTVLARSWTADGGRPHAETRALEQAGEEARGGTLYVTLEPCTHHGETPPCVDAIIESGIKRVVIGMIDVDPRVAGKSIKHLESAGLEVVQNVQEEACKALNGGFIKRVTENRPFVTLKTACTLDGKIACASGESQWITGELARRHVHQLRSQYDAILIGSGTALADDPMLSTRLDGVDHSSVRVVLDSSLSIFPDSKLVQSARDIPLWLLHQANGDNYSALEKAGVVLHQVNCKDLKAVLSLLANQGITRVLIEGGARIHGSFLRQGCCDELLIYRAPTILGEEGKSVVGALGIETLVQRYDFDLSSSLTLGVDVLERYIRKTEG